MTTSAADLIVVADRIHTLDPENPAAQVIAMRDGRIVGVGDRADAHPGVAPPPRSSTWAGRR